MYHMPELREIDQHKIEPLNLDVNVIYFNTVEAWCFTLKADTSFFDLRCIAETRFVVFLHGENTYV